MVAYLRWLAEEYAEVLGIVPTSHLSGVAERLEGEEALEKSLIQEPSYADPNTVHEYTFDFE